MFNFHLNLWNKLFIIEFFFFFFFLFLRGEFRVDFGSQASSAHEGLPLSSRFFDKFSLGRSWLLAGWGSLTILSLKSFLTTSSFDLFTSLSVFFHSAVGASTSASSLSYSEEQRSRKNFSEDFHYDSASACWNFSDSLPPDSDEV